MSIESILFFTLIQSGPAQSKPKRESEFRRSGCRGWRVRDRLWFVSRGLMPSVTQSSESIKDTDWLGLRYSSAWPGQVPRQEGLQELAYSSSGFRIESPTPITTRADRTVFFFFSSFLLDLIAAHYSCSRPRPLRRHAPHLSTPPRYDALVRLVHHQLVDVELHRPRGEVTALVLVSIPLAVEAELRLLLQGRPPPSTPPVRRARPLELQRVRTQLTRFDSEWLRRLQLQRRCLAPPLRRV